MDAWGSRLVLFDDWGGDILSSKRSFSVDEAPGPGRNMLCWTNLGEEGMPEGWAAGVQTATFP